MIYILKSEGADYERERESSSQSSLVCCSQAACAVQWSSCACPNLVQAAVGRAQVAIFWRALLAVLVQYSLCVGKKEQQGGEFIGWLIGWADG